MKISVIMSVYNGGATLRQAIDSVLSQTARDFEFIIIDDASTDQTSAILNSYAAKDARIKIIRNAENRRLISNLNTGLQQAQGEFAARIDADDCWSDKQKLQKQLDFFAAHPDCVLLGTWAQVVDENMKPLFKISPPVSDQQIRSQILRRNCFVHSSIMAKTAAMRAAGGYRPNELHCEDYGLWLRMGLAGKFANLPETLLNYRINEQGITLTNNRLQISNSWQLARKFKGNYAGFAPAWIKWHVQILVSYFLNPRVLFWMKR